MEVEKKTQLRFALEAAHEELLEHSGIVVALARVRDALENGERTAFSLFTIDGPRGSGKSHFLRAIADEAKAKGRVLRSFDFGSGEPDDSLVSGFIDAYESMKSSGGTLIVADGRRVANPHVASRVAFAIPLELDYPRDEELRPLVKVLLERRGLRFAEPMIDFVLSRVPADPLSLSSIFAKIDELSMADGRRPNRALVRAAIA